MNRLFFLTIILSALLRLILVDKLPPSLNWDEVSLGYNAYSILTSGKDEWGEFLPTIFRAYGDYKLPGYIYADLLPILTFGLNAFSVRLPSIVSGIGLVAVTFFLTRKLLSGLVSSSLLPYVQLLAAFLVAISPWSLFLSRIALEANLAIFLISLGVLCLLSKKLLSGLLLLGCAVWTYNSARVFVPLLLVVWGVSRRKSIFAWVGKNNRQAGVALSVLLLFFLPMFYQLTQGAGLARYQKLNLVDEGAIARIENQRNTSSLPKQISRLIYNRYTFGLSHFTKNYLNHFSPSFLFLKGGSNYQFNIPGVGLLFPFTLPFFYLGLFLAIVKLRQSPVLGLWLLLSPVASALTRDSPHTLRAIIMLPLPMILVSLGFTVLAKVKPKLIFSVLTILLITNLSYYLYTYYHSYGPKYSHAWQYGYREAVEFVNAHPEYKTVIVSKKYGEPHEFFLFYLRYPPAEYTSATNLVRYFQSDWYWVDKFDKFYFLNDWQIKDMVTELGETVNSVKPALLITSPGNYPNGWTKIDTIFFLDAKPAFDILEQR